MVKAEKEMANDRDLTRRIGAPSDWRKRTTVTIAEASKILSCSTMHLYNEVAKQHIPGIYVGSKLTIPVGWLRQIIGDPVDLQASGI